MSVIPFTTSWASQYRMYRMPNMIYGLLFIGIAYVFLQKEIVKMTDKKDKLGQRIGQDYNGNLSLTLWSFGILISYFSSHLAMTCYLLIAILWLFQGKIFSQVIVTTLSVNKD